MSYKKAWGLIDDVNSREEKSVVTKNIGGKSGGGTVLTPYGKSLVQTFDKINESCWKHLDKQINSRDLG